MLTTKAGMFAGLAALSLVACTPEQAPEPAPTEAVQLDENGEVVEPAPHGDGQPK